MKKIKLIIVIFVLCLSCLPLTGCYDAVGIENLAYVVALGIDEGTEDNIKLTFQFAILNNSGESSSDNSSQSTSSTVVDIECKTIDDGISLVNSYISKKINLSHCKAVVISESLASKGISNYFFSLINNIQLRPDCNIIVSRCDAYDFLANAHPTLEPFSARYYELILNSSKYSGYTEDVLMSEFYSNTLNTANHAVAILGGVNSKPTQYQKTSNSINEGYMANETPTTSESNIENMGLAVFNGDIMVGELNNIETFCHLIISNELENATINIPNPFNFNNNISIYIGLNKKTKSSVFFVNNYPYIKNNVYITGNVLSLDDTLDLSNQYTIDIIEEYVSTYLKEIISNYLYKTAKDFKSDIDDFGKHVVGNYLNWEDWISSDWLNNYENSFFEVNVTTTIQSGYLFTKF